MAPTFIDQSSIATQRCVGKLANRLLRRAAARAVFAIAIATALLVPAVGPTTPAVAADPIVRDHRELGRLEVVVKKVHIFDDRDWGAGEIRINVSIDKLRECPNPEPGGQGFCHDPVASSLINFSADSGETVVLNRIVPGPGDEMADPSTGPGIGFPVSAGPGYRLTISGYESDTGRDDALGNLVGILSEQNGWGPIGTYDERGTYCEVGYFPVPDFSCGNPAKYSVEYEIRRVPLADLVPITIRVASESSGDRDDLVCFTVQNRGAAASGPFHVNLEAAEAVVPGPSIGAYDLAAGESREQCTGFAVPDSGALPVMLTVDRERSVVEEDEQNNILLRTLVHTRLGDSGPITTTGNANAGAGTSEPSQSDPVVILIADKSGGAGGAQASVAKSESAQADFVVSAIRVNGRVPDGKKDCQEGKNDVAVVVKNQGAAAAASFSVRLVVNDDAIEKTAAAIDAGQEREVRFGDVRLKKGDRQLTALADATQSITEANEDNNERKVTARCEEGD
jgi:hypothetical protein